MLRLDALPAIASHCIRPKIPVEGISSQEGLELSTALNNALEAESRENCIDYAQLNWGAPEFT